MSTPAARLLAPLRRRDYRLLAVGSLVSLWGDGLFLAAIAIQVYAISNVPTAMAAVGMVWAGSQLAFLLIGGLVSDRLERRRVMVGADLLRCVTVGTIGLLSLAGELQLWHLLALGSVFGAGNAFYNPSATSIVPDLLPKDELAQANAFLGIARPAMQRMAGPAAGGVIVATAGPGAAFLVDAGTFLFSAAMLGLMRQQPVAASAAGRGLRATVADMGEGLRFVRSHRWCWAWLVGAAVALLAFTGPVEVLLPYLLLNDMGLTESQAAYQLGAILAVGGLGSMCVSAAVGQLDLPRRFVTAMYLTQAAGLSMLAVYGAMSSLWHALLASAALGGAFAFGDIAWTTLLQRRVPRRLLGRVASVDWLTSLGLIPVSYALTGTLAARFGPRPLLVAAALLGSLTMLALYLVPGVRAPEQTANGPGGAAPDPALGGSPADTPPAVGPRRGRGAATVGPPRGG